MRILIKDVCLKYDEQQAREPYRLWRQAIQRCFISQRILGVIDSIYNKIEFGDVTVVDSQYPQVVIEVIVRAVIREVRGIGA